MLDLKDGQSGNIDLNELWKQLLLQAGDNQLQLADGSSNNLSIVVANDNQANLENNIEVTASTGNNQTNNNNNGDLAMKKPKIELATIFCLSRLFR